MHYIGNMIFDACDRGQRDLIKKVWLQKKEMHGVVELAVMPSTNAKYMMMGLSGIGVEDGRREGALNPKDGIQGSVPPMATPDQGSVSLN